MSLVEGAGSPAAAVTVGLDRVREMVEELAGIDLHTVPGEVTLGVLDRVEEVRRRLEALNAKALATVEADGLWALDGARSMAAWYRTRTGKHRASAAREVRQARALRDHLPATAQALAAGEISADHVSALVRHTTGTDARRATLRDEAVGEEFLLGHARELDASAFATAVEHWAQRADPDAADRAYVAESGREEFYLAETTEGYVPGGWLSRASGQLVLTALAARGGVPARDDRRTPRQRNAANLTGLARLGLDSGTLRPGARIRPHLSVHVPFDTLQRLIAATRPARRHPTCPLPDAPAPTGHDAAGHAGAAGAGPAGHAGAAFGLPAPPAADDPRPAGTDRAAGAVAAGATHPGTAGQGGGGVCGCGQDLPEAVITADLDPAALTDLAPATLPNGTALAPTLLARLACDGGFHRVVFGPDSEALDVGREERLFTTAQTRAIIARDKNCRYPGCDAPPGEGEIHHSIWWHDHHGRTDTKLGVLLCWHHHEHVHQRRISIERRHTRWKFYRRDGTEIEHPRHTTPRH
ncbi:uncharacterized protein DUF222 [Georgenia soli]|uniref:Uncharacterized protein DUF222 n=1 Tax=Georgenia soli TaxID=638953 RepID=A0A2A9EP43_9MICO|nr:HNH endonuclease signature motif containing protein [Georgenia soli]PFG40734.1 uncharacterized protein DUF222 [Georgenia soli]